MTYLSWAVFAAALFAAGVDLLYLVIFPRGDKWWLRFMDALAIIYFGFLYLMMGLGRFDLSEFGPTLIRPGIGMLLLLLAAEPLYDLLRGKPWK